MGTHIRSQGFTIIEVMLFLAVSSVLAVGILATSSIAINNQRYRDALNSLQSTLQEQYNQTAHVINDREGVAERCGSTGVSATNQAQAQLPGTSECLVMGRFISISDGQAITTSNVLGYKDVGESDPKTDTEALKMYQFFVDPSTVSSSEVAWGGTVDARRVADNEVIASGVNESFVMVVLRSPLTGVVRTYSYVSTKPTEILAEDLVANNQQATKLCLATNSFGVGSKLGVLISERSASSGGIELLTEENAKC